MLGSLGAHPAQATLSAESMQLAPLYACLWVKKYAYPWDVAGH